MKKLRLVLFLVAVSISVVYFIANGGDEPIDAENWDEFEKEILYRYDYLDSFEVES